jgi:hypothetical protein
VGDGKRPVGWEVIEVMEGELAIVLWTLLRGLYEWVKPTADQTERLRLFSPPSDASRARLLAAAGEAPQIAGALARLAAMREAPGEVSPAHIGAACAEISQWAEKRSLLDVGAHFAEAGAYADPENPRLANAAGRLCRRLRDYERSAAWFRRARYAAVRSLNKPERIRALLGYGGLMRVMGRYEEAEAHYILAARLAERTRRPKQAAESHHDLLAIAILTDDLDAAETHVWEALRLYPARHPHLAVLAHDWAFALVLRRFYAAAVPLIQLALDRVRVQEYRTLMFSTLARAGAGAGLLDVHAGAEAQTLRHLPRFAEYGPAVLINLAQAQWLFEAWGPAEAYARRAQAAARSHADERYQRDASELLRRLRRREAPPTQLAPPLPDVIDSVRARIAARLREAPAPRPGNAEGEPST